MDRINGADTIDIGAGRRGFRSENLVAGQAGTEVTADFLNSIQEELLGLIEASGLVADDESWGQLLRAVRSQKLNYFTAGGTANALTITPSPAFGSLADLVGVPLRIQSSAGNTGAMTLNVSGLGAVALTRKAGGALASGDWPSGVTETVVYDGTAFRLQSSVSGEFAATGVPSSRYTRLENGLLMQWGGVTANSSGPVTVTFPIAFTTAVQSVVVTDQSSPVTPSQGSVMLTGAITLTGFSVIATQNFSTAITDGGFYIAMGY